MDTIYLLWNSQDAECRMSNVCGLVLVPRTLVARASIPPLGTYTVVEGNIILFTYEGLYVDSLSLPYPQKDSQLFNLSLPLVVVSILPSAQGH
jgi:hypothetical protein